MIIDAHFHLWQLSRGDYDWITEDLKVLYRDYFYQDWKTEQNDKIWGGILVQCAPTSQETEYLIAQAEKQNDVIGVVGWVDLDAHDAKYELSKLAKQSKIVGIRPMLQDLDDPKWILQKNVLANLQHCAELGLCFDALITPTQLPYFCEAAAQLEELRIVIDHAAKPDLRHPECNNTFYLNWQQHMSYAAQMDNVFCKFSGLLTEAKEGAGLAELRPCFDFLFQHFGIDRLIWGSDWPVLKLAQSYDYWLHLCIDLLDDLSVKERQKIFAANALVFYQIPLENPVGSIS